MSIKARLSCIILACLLSPLPVFSQDAGYNTLYSPLALVKRLSYENFRDIKLLQAANVILQKNQARPLGDKM